MLHIRSLYSQVVPALHLTAGRESLTKGMWPIFVPRRFSTVLKSYSWTRVELIIIKTPNTKATRLRTRAQKTMSVTHSTSASNVKFLEISIKTLRFLVIVTRDSSRNYAIHSHIKDGFLWRNDVFWQTAHDIHYIHDIYDKKVFSYSVFSFNEAFN